MNKMKKATLILAMLFAAATAHAVAMIDWAVTGQPGPPVPVRPGPIMHKDGSAVGVYVGSADQVPWTVYLIFADMKEDIVSAIESGTFNYLVNDLTLASTKANNGHLDVSQHYTVESPLLTVYEPAPAQGPRYDFVMFYFNEEYTGLEGSSGSYFFSGIRNERAYSDKSAPTEATFYYLTLHEYDSVSNPVGGTWYNYAIVPEPSTAALLMLGVAALGSRRRARK
jgi:PEP-CTERM putative exosortase interaction domain